MFPETKERQDTMPIARTWTGATRASDAESYLDYLRKTGLREYGGTPGNEGVLALRRIDGDRAEFTIVSLWHDESAVAGFAGAEPRQAVFYPEDDRFLVRRDETADHHEVVYVAGGPISPGTPRRPGRIERLLTWWTDHAGPALPAPRLKERPLAG